MYVTVTWRQLLLPLQSESLPPGPSLSVVARTHGVRDVALDAGNRGEVARQWRELLQYDVQANRLTYIRTRSVAMGRHKEGARPRPVLAPSSSMHLHLDHDNCLEVAFLRGKTKEVRQFAHRIVAQTGVRHGSVQIVPVTLEKAAKGHDHGDGVHHVHLQPAS